MKTAALLTAFTALLLGGILIGHHVTPPTHREAGNTVIYAKNGKQVAKLAATPAPESTPVRGALYDPAGQVVLPAVVGRHTIESTPPQGDIALTAGKQVTAALPIGEHTSATQYHLQGDATLHLTITHGTLLLFQVTKDYTEVTTTTITGGPYTLRPKAGTRLFFGTELPASGQRYTIQALAN